MEAGKIGSWEAEKIGRWEKLLEIPGFFVDRMRQLDYINEETIMEF